MNFKVVVDSYSSSSFTSNSSVPYVDIITRGNAIVWIEVKLNNNSKEFIKRPPANMISIVGKHTIYFVSEPLDNCFWKICK